MALDREALRRATEASRTRVPTGLAGALHRLRAAPVLRGLPLQAFALPPRLAAEGGGLVVDFVLRQGSGFASLQVAGPLGRATLDREGNVLAYTPLARSFTDLVLTDDPRGWAHALALFVRDTETLLAGAGDAPSHDAAWERLVGPTLAAACRAATPPPASP
jgi:hypothetical protein